MFDQLFSFGFSEYLDDNLIQFSEVILREPIGKHEKGTPFDVVIFNTETGVLSLCNYSSTLDELVFKETYSTTITIGRQLQTDTPGS